MQHAHPACNMLILPTSDLATNVTEKLVHVTQESHVAGLPIAALPLHSSRSALTSHSFAPVLMKIFLG